MMLSQPLQRLACGLAPGVPAVPRNQMGGSTPSCYNRVNSKLLLTLSTGPKGLLGAVASVRGLGGDAGVPWLPAASVDVAEYLKTLVGRAAGLATGSRGPSCPPGYVQRSEDRLCEPQSRRLAEAGMARRPVGCGRCRAHRGHGASPPVRSAENLSRR